ncbi:MAG: aspartate/glutamate racemase family protein [Acidimicrobiales bacterium]|jgi:aspartate racemase
MKRLGLLGGMSWESSIEYERTINELVRERVGGLASADLIIRSFNFADIEALQVDGRWDEAGRVLADAAVSLADAGADAIIVCTNTMHRLADVIQSAVSIPLLHIADATAAAVKASGVDVVALLGTRYTMELDYYVGRLRNLHGLTVIVPDESDRVAIHRVIYEELVRGIINPQSKSEYLMIVDRLLSNGALGVISGCTEIELLIHPEDLRVPMFPTAYLHAVAAVDFALSE